MSKAEVKWSVVEVGSLSAFGVETVDDVLDDDT